MVPMMTPTTATTSTKSIADLTTSIRRATGDVPPPLIGASTTVIGDRVYLFGGRVKTSAKVYNRIYVLSLTTLVWTRVTPKNKSPHGRYFHSADALDNNRIVFYGGLTVAMTEVEGLLSLGDLFILHITDDNIDELRWEFPNMGSTHLPYPRYSHLSAVAHDNYLVVLGGQDINTGFINEINVYDIHQKAWRAPYPLKTHFSAYQTAAAIITPLSTSVSPAMSISRFLNNSSNTSGTENSKDDEEQELTHQQTLCTAIFAYSNQNFHDLERTLHQITISEDGHVDAVIDHTNALTNGKQNTPPGLRFLSGSACGQHLVVVGPYTTPDWQQLQIWALDIITMAWTRIETGPNLYYGSWLRGMMWEGKNRFVMFGRPEGSTQDDYTQRLVHFDHLVNIDMEAFGVYTPPQPTYNPTAQEAGLALLNNPALCDLTILTVDGQRVRANSYILAQRWPTIYSQLDPFMTPKRRSPEDNIPLSQLSLTFPDTHTILVAFLQFLYTDHLATVEQNQPRVITHLLILADLFSIQRLKVLATHALHQMLQISTAPLIYQTAALADCPSLQIRALRIMVNAKKLMQEQQAHKELTSTSTTQKQQKDAHTHAVQPGTLSPPPATQPAEMKLNGVASFLVGASGPSGGPEKSFQPLSKLLRQYDLEAPLPLLKQDIAAVIRSPDGNVAPPLIRAKNPARGAKQVPSSRDFASSQTSTTNSSSSGGSRSSLGTRKTPPSSMKTKDTPSPSSSSGQKLSRNVSSGLTKLF